MGVSDWIAVISATASFFISVVAIWQSRKSIKLTEQTINEANRPYLAIYYDDISVTGTILTYLIVKNFGNTGAYIKHITCSPDFTSELAGDSGNPFVDFKNAFIAPGQSYTTGIFVGFNNNDDRVENRQFEIEYFYGNETFKETFIFNEKSTQTLKFVKASPNNKKDTADVILRASQEFLRRNL